LDRDRSAASRRVIESFAGSRYFRERLPLGSEAEIDRRLRSGELRLVIEIPPGFGKDLLTGRVPEIGFIIDGAMPFRAETVRGYAHGIVSTYVQDLGREASVQLAGGMAASLEPRFRYNQAFRSTFAMTPGCIMLLLVLIPSMLTALGVVREREVGSIINLHASPASVGEFLLGKQLPYIAIGMTSFVALVLLVAVVFGVMIRGSAAALGLAALLYVGAATALGLLISTFVRTQVAAIIAAAVITTLPAINFSGYLYPAATLEGVGRFIGLGFPSLWFQNVSIGTFTKARGFSDFPAEYLALAAFAAGFLVLASFLLRKQEP
jgi:ribosome-dependent ATPase